MESMHSLTEMKNRVCLVEPKRAAVRYFREITGNIAKTRKFYISRKKLNITLLEKRQAKKEAEVVRTVDWCRYFISDRIKDFFAGYKIQVRKYAVEIVSKKKEIDCQWFFESLIEENDFKEMQMEIKHRIQQELEVLFGVKSVEIAGIRLEMDSSGTHQRINRLLKEQYKTIVVAEKMKDVSNLVWDECIGRMNLPLFLDRIVGKIKLGSIFTKTVQCQPQREVIHCQKEIEKYLTGVLMNNQVRLTQEMQIIATKIFYTLFDQMTANEMDTKIVKWASENKNAIVKRRVSLQLVKQAFIS